MDYKNTLNLPKTDFPMKADLPKREPEILKFWQENNIYKKLIEKNNNNRTFVLHDGPPYANGHIHIGHALNKILKDMIIKFKSMHGYKAEYVPGWDCHGLPIEHNVDKALGQKKHSMTMLDIRRECRLFAQKFVDIQRQEFIRLGVLGRWEEPYLTMNYSYESAIVEELSKIIRNGYVYKGIKPVYWCAHCVTALAEAEVEYEDHTSPSIYVRFNVKDDRGKLPSELKGKHVYFVIWTTTPWTLPANLAITVHPEFNYVAYRVVTAHSPAPDVDAEPVEFVYIVAEALLENLKKVLPGWQEGNVMATMKGKALEGIVASHPFYNRDSVITLGDYVTTDIGTGCVHTAPGHGAEDYETGMKYGLKMYSPVDRYGRFTNDVEFFAGKFVFDADKEIIQKLKETGALLKQQDYVHSYPHCWRCKKPVITRATEQWFISVEKHELRKEALKAIDRVEWIPSWGKDRIHGMLETRPDWCISRQRVWGVPIPVFYCKTCGQSIVDADIALRVAQLFKSNGADVWFEKDATYFIPEGYKCPSCGARDFEKEQNILDVWFDSGVSHAVVLKHTDNLTWPADLYLEGSDQHRGWFQSTLLASLTAGHGIPYRAVLTHGFVVDEKGRKMSKQLGNVIAPQEVIDKYGADVLRLWVSAEDFRGDVSVSKDILERLKEAYRKIRNTIKFILGNLYDFNPELHRVEPKDMKPVDLYMLYKTSELVKRIDKAYVEYNFHIVYHAILDFCVVDLSAFYLDILKDRLYVSKPDSQARRSAQTVLYDILHALVVLIAPVLSFTAEEAWRYIPGRQSESVFLTDYMQKHSFTEPDMLLYQDMERLRAIRDEVNKALEIQRVNRVIGSSLEALVEIHADHDNYELLNRYANYLTELFIVSQVEIKQGTGTLQINIHKARGSKCERCWNYSDSVGKDSVHPTLCSRCVEALS
ncbi:MAG: isoleucine--tRNA ligase [bacterium]